MIVSEAIFYSSIISWVLYWWFIGNITKKVGMLGKVRISGEILLG